MVEIRIKASVDIFKYNAKGRHSKKALKVVVFIGPESDHWLPLSLTDSLRNV